MGKKKKTVQRIIRKGEMVDIGRVFHTKPSLYDFQKEVKRISGDQYPRASYVIKSNGAIYKADAKMVYQGMRRFCLFLLVKRNVQGRLQFQMTRTFVDEDNDEADLFDRLEIIGMKGIEFHHSY